MAAILKMAAIFVTGRI